VEESEGMLSKLQEIVEKLTLDNRSLNEKLDN
jgi:hypothetical protein